MSASAGACGGTRGSLRGEAGMGAASARVLQPGRWTASFAVHLALLLLAIPASRLAGSADWLLAALLAAFASVQIGFLAHDLDHGHVTSDRRLRRVLGLLCWNLLLGVSQAWWRDKHRRHHLHTHRPGHDPDLYALFGHDAAGVSGLSGLHRRFVGWQSWLFWPVTLFARAYFQCLGLAHGWRAGGASRWVELLPLLAHHVLLGSAAAWAFGWSGAGFLALMLALSGLYMGLGFATNHLGVPHARARGRGTLWQAAHTRNIRTGPLGDYLLGGLNLQIEHHVLPWLPRSRLRAASPGVRARCAQAGLPYREASLWRALVELHAELERVARTARAR